MRKSPWVASAMRCSRSTAGRQFGTLEVLQCVGDGRGREATGAPLTPSVERSTRTPQLCVGSDACLVTDLSTGTDPLVTVFRELVPCTEHGHVAATRHRGAGTPPMHAESRSRPCRLTRPGKETHTAGRVARGPRRTQLTRHTAHEHMDTHTHATHGAHGPTHQHRSISTHRAAPAQALAIPPAASKRQRSVGLIPMLRTATQKPRVHQQHTAHPLALARTYSNGRISHRTPPRP